MHNTKTLFYKIPFEYRLSIIYLIIGGLWILFSDQIAARLTHDEKTLTLIQHYKGWFYVLATAFSLFLFVKKHNHRLRRAEEISKENDKLKTVFLENISHELRTPMNAIIGFTEMAQTESAEREDINQYLDIIMSSSKQLLSIVNDVMDTSLLESGNVYINREVVQLGPFVNDVHDYFAPLMKDDVKLRVDTQNTDLSIYTDKEKLTRIFHNLINNAIKFTHKGQIDLGYRLNKQNIVFFVKDTGIGIKPNLHKIIFERFKQAQIELENRTGGTGLGLSICKEMLALLGGEIWLNSETGKGSNFFFSMPYEQNTA